MQLKDKHEKERYDLYLEIATVERKEDELSLLSRNYQKNLEEFFDQFSYLSNEIETLLYSSPTNQQSIQELQDNMDLNQAVNRYVDHQLDEVQQVKQRLMNTLEEERERLVKERNNLPWE